MAVVPRNARPHCLHRPHPLHPAHCKETRYTSERTDSLVLSIVECHARSFVGLASAVFDLVLHRLLRTAVVILELGQLLVVAGRLLVLRLGRLLSLPRLRQAKARLVELLLSLLHRRPGRHDVSSRRPRSPAALQLRA